MKSIAFLVLAFCLGLANCFAQDTINLSSGARITGKVLEIGQLEIKYKRSDNLDGPLYSLQLSLVKSVFYENGTRDVFEATAMPQTQLPAVPTDMSTYIKGQRDAAIYYKGYKPASTVTLIFSMLYPPIGLVPAIACTASRPKENTLQYPNTALMQQVDYYNGYTQKARRIKTGAVWRNWAIGFGFNLGLFLVLNN